MILEKMATFGFVQERWLQSYFSFDVEFPNKNKILPNAFVCEPNSSQTKNICELRYQGTFTQVFLPSDFYPETGYTTQVVGKSR